MVPKFLFINIGFDFLGIASRIQKEGYETFSHYIVDKDDGKISTGKNIIPIVDDIFDVINKFKDKKDELIILVDDNGLGDQMDYLRYEGWHVIGSSHFSDKSEHDRGFGNELAKKIGLEIPPTKEFTDIESCKEFIKNIKDKNTQLVFKGDGVDLSGSSKTYLAKDINDMLHFVNWIEKDKEEKNYELTKFEVQQKIDGIETDFSSWHNSGQFINNVNFDFEEKRINGLGAAVGCYGQIISFTPAKTSLLFNKYIKNLSPILSKVGEVNEWAINSIITKDKKVYFLEFTPRFGWDSMIGELAILQDSGHKISDFFIRLAFKKPFPSGYFPVNKYSCSIRLYSDSSGTDVNDIKDKPIFWDKRIEDNLWLRHVKKNDSGEYVITKNPIGVISAVGNSPEEAIEKVYQMIDPKNKYLSTPDLFYHPEIGKRAIEAYKTLREWKIIE